jgi:hypothetical protein
MDEFGIGLVIVTAIAAAIVWSKYRPQLRES